VPDLTQLTELWDEEEAVTGFCCRNNYLSEEAVEKLPTNFLLEGYVLDPQKSEAGCRIFF